jgi:hypothetical protein
LHAAVFLVSERIAEIKTRLMGIRRAQDGKTGKSQGFRCLWQIRAARLDKAQEVEERR